MSQLLTEPDFAICKKFFYKGGFYTKRHHLFPISVANLAPNRTKITFDEQAIRPRPEDFRALSLLLQNEYPNLFLDYTEEKQGTLFLTDHTGNPDRCEATLRRAEADVLRWLKTWF